MKLLYSFFQHFSLSLFKSILDIDCIEIVVGAGIVEVEVCTAEEVVDKGPGQVEERMELGLEMLFVDKGSRQRRFLKITLIWIGLASDFRGRWRNYKSQFFTQNESSKISPGTPGFPF